VILLDRGEPVVVRLAEPPHRRNTRSSKYHVIGSQRE
jgi:hypothetical protein